MARTLKVGATYPAVKGQATDSTGAVADLSSALALEMIAISGTHVISGPAIALTPPLADADGVHHWNWEYALAADDTQAAGQYNVYLKVSWTATEIEFFPDEGAETLTIEAVD